jgi:predicted esterase
MIGHRVRRMDAMRVMIRDYLKALAAMPCKLLFLWVVVILAFGSGPAGAFELKPYKDRLFAYPGILDSRDGGNYLVVDYREMRDINGRDKIPERRVERRYVDLLPKRRQSEQTFETDAGEISFFAVGNPKGARIVTVYVHGRGGDRNQGVNDYSFGGNFNRIKNLMVRNNGVYIAPDGGNLDDRSATRIRLLLHAIYRQVPGAQLVLACGSAGGAICHSLAHDDLTAGRLAGIALLGSFGSDSFIGSAAYRNRVPVFIAHGGADSVIPVEGAETFYRNLRRTDGYPVRMVRFETGGHGTPIRMTDWRDMINWMLRARVPG